MKRARREFLKATAAGAILGIAGAARSEDRQSEPKIPIPTQRAKALMALFGLKYPIFEAPHGRQTCPELAIAISNAGAMGALASIGNPEEKPELLFQKCVQPLRARSLSTSFSQLRRCLGMSRHR
jgi:hypothetical protein